jgi:hypothetical protein
MSVPLFIIDIDGDASAIPIPPELLALLRADAERVTAKYAAMGLSGEGTLASAALSAIRTALTRAKADRTAHSDPSDTPLSD